MIPEETKSEAPKKRGRPPKQVAITSESIETLKESKPVSSAKEIHLVLEVKKRAPRKSQSSEELPTKEAKKTTTKSKSAPKQTKKTSKADL